MSAILIFLKAPHKGYVKTRLAHDVGPERALQVYRALVMRQCSALPTQAQLEVHYTPSDAGPEMQKWLGRTASYFPQKEGDLGTRLQGAIEQAFKRGAQTVTCIGGDCPQLETKHFEQANQLLAKGHDIVFGPSEDGGYYLAALKAPIPELFQDIPWSTGETLQVSLQRARDLQLKVGLLEALYDIDEVSELNRALADKRIQLECLPPDIQSG
ncbi:TIGR04282 family arsenosugar biosynthesis glycosyltransferase [Coraliomargarita sp. SDUM461003]|uniref:TIGR04282 family arsenosugar biosynthesis glycosyltransferase n=1 Tax=Thalassobacterium maritimum TaxID=3041265 RepID=A0ABU1AQR4_9BACT|nr:TIGR04282 family arsenosugar biosynthesis glycosyltransferase [Coraliomargarita sp. SDUM461003]MDQ8206494.1 TIGR04282 family arsenosugar biosynthesis glycosyltransferase [Coraliomargarita sp. SDUM461003]